MIKKLFSLEDNPDYEISVEFACWLSNKFTKTVELLNHQEIDRLDLLFIFFEMERVKLFLEGFEGEREYEDYVTRLRNYKVSVEEYSEVMEARDNNRSIQDKFLDKAYELLNKIKPCVSIAGMRSIKTDGIEFEFCRVVGSVNEDDGVVLHEDEWELIKTHTQKIIDRIKCYSEDKSDFTEFMIQITKLTEFLSDKIRKKESDAFEEQCFEQQNDN